MLHLFILYFCLTFNYQTCDDLRDFYSSRNSKRHRRGTSPLNSNSKTLTILQGKKAAQASAAHLSALEGDSKGAAANDLPPPPPPMTDFPPPPPPITESVIPEVHPQSASFSVGHAAPMAVGGAMMAQGGPAHAGDQNYFGSIVQVTIIALSLTPLFIFFSAHLYLYITF